MQNRTIRLLGVAALLPALVSCNLYSPLEGSGSVQDHLEIAHKCLAEGDYACAEAEYKALPNGSLKEQKLCVLNLGRAGFGLKALANVFDDPGAKVMGAIAQQVLPYSAERYSSADNAKSHCTNFAAQASADEDKLGTLLKTLGLLVHCATQMSKTTALAATSNSDTACNTPVTGNASSVTPSHIAADNAGAISSSQPGMCAADAVACRNDFLAIDRNKLQAAGLGDIARAYDNAPPALKDSNSDASAIRAALRLTL